LRAGALAIELIALVAGFGSAAAHPALRCTGAQKPWMVAELLFGRSRTSDKAWARFLATEITPRFPDGLTVLDGRGQWRGRGSSRIIKERSTVVMIAMPPSAHNNARLQAIIEAYKVRFRQRSVGLILRPACVSF
jgi:hypothetical protein